MTADAATGALKGFAAVGRQPVVHEKFDRAQPDFKPMVPRIVKADAQAVLFIGAGGAVAEGLRQLRAAGHPASHIVTRTHAELNLTDQAAVRADVSLK